ncbi:hypothetical protein [Thermohalobacter berrensis]|uniref:Uncharacterized protein n=1 Tax=Thermohalobacter berrensis TaxID=99594 RepID=A0A419T5A1_9FIRM|nr:hypothetical protein [Thermohalobacter berrensis]RKD32578.1 hypothetical protein BET03_10915 [Thermohalobacter berrensis]
MKQYSIFFILIIILLSIFICKTYFYSPPNDPNIIEALSINEKLSKLIIENYFSDNANLKKTSEEKIKTTVLKDIGYENWIDYIDYIKLNVYPIDIIGDNKEDLLVSLNISKDNGVIAIYKPYGENYIYQNKIENLTYIEKLSAIKFDKNKNFIFVEEILDETIGAFFYDHFIIVFTNINNSYKEVFRQSINYESYFFEKWSNPDIDNPKWFKLTEEAILDYAVNQNNQLTINISKTIAKYIAKDKDGSIPEIFDLVEKKNFEERYLWSNKYNYFILKEGKIISNNEKVGIISDSSKTPDSLLFPGERYYKIIDKNGKIKYIKSKEISILN